MELLLQRDEGRTATPGTLFVDGDFECFTLEDVVRERVGVPVAEWKVHGQTAIPAGRYRVSLERSARFGADTITIHDVPGFIGVRMHGGNSAEDTEGCPLVGDQLDGERIKAGTSRPALQRLKTKLLAAQLRGEEISIDIRNAELQA